MLGEGHKTGRPTEKMHLERASEEILKVGGNSLLRPSKGDKSCKDLLTNPARKEKDLKFYGG